MLPHDEYVAYLHLQLRHRVYLFLANIADVFGQFELGSVVVLVQERDGEGDADEVALPPSVPHLDRHPVLRLTLKIQTVPRSRWRAVVHRDHTRPLVDRKTESNKIDCLE